MSRRRAGDSSLELLLDTICNTFGGVLFLAILVSLLLKSTRDRAMESSAAAPRTKPAISKAEVIRRTTEASELAEEISRLDSALGHIQGFVKQFAKPGFDESLKKLHDEQHRRNEAEARLTALLAAIAADQTATTTASAEAESARHRQATSKASAEQAAERLQSARQTNAALAKAAAILQLKVNEKNVVQSAGKAPRERDTDKLEVGLLLRYGRVYRIHTHTDGGRTANTADFVVTEGLTENSAKARPGGGIDISAADANAKLKALLKNYPSDDWYVCMAVFPDSYDTFQILKSLLVENGYEYRLIATEKGIYDQGGGGAKVQ